MGTQEVASAVYWLHWLTVLKYVGGALVVLGVAAELLGDWFSEPLQKKVDEERTSEIARLSTEAETARASIADANARALEAQLALEKFKAPRVLSPEQRERVAGKMKQFAGQEFFGSIASSVGDAWDLWQKLNLTLETANWVRVAPPGLAVGIPPAGVPIMPEAGVMILIAPNRWNDLHPRAQALADALTAEGISAGAGAANGDPEKKPNAVMIVIGPKPP